MASTTIPVQAGAAPAPVGRSRRRRRDDEQAPWWFRGPFIVLSLSMVVPFYWMLISAFKRPSELSEVPPTWWPQEPTLNGFSDPDWSREERSPGHFPGLFQLFEDVPLGFGRMILNSLLVTVLVTIGSLLIASLAAYVITKHRIRGRRLIFIAVIGSMMIPWQVTLIPAYLIVRNFGWLDSYQGLVVPGLAKAFAVFFLVQYMRSVPDELIQAARVDGAGEWRIWWTIVMPLIRPALAAMAIFITLGEWNNFLWPLIIVQSDAMATIPVALAGLPSAQQSLDYQGAVMVGALIASVPTVIFFLLFQKHFTKGIALSGIKG